MTPVVTTQYSWTVFGPGGRYGVLQYQVGATPVDSQKVETVLFFAGSSFQSPLTIFEMMMLVAFMILVAAVALFYVRRRLERVV